MSHHGPEFLVKQKLKDYLRQRGFYWFMPVQTGYGATSLDFLCCCVGEFVAYECKARGKNLTPRQRLVARQITNSGGKVYLVTLNDAGELEFNVVGQGT